MQVIVQALRRSLQDAPRLLHVSHCSTTTSGSARQLAGLSFTQNEQAGRSYNLEGFHHSSSPTASQQPSKALFSSVPGGLGIVSAQPFSSRRGAAEQRLRSHSSCQCQRCWRDTLSRRDLHSSSAARRGTHIRHAASVQLVPHRGGSCAPALEWQAADTPPCNRGHRGYSVPAGHSAVPDGPPAFAFDIDGVLIRGGLVLPEARRALARLYAPGGETSTILHPCAFFSRA